MNLRPLKTKKWRKVILRKTTISIFKKYCETYKKKDSNIFPKTYWAIYDKLRKFSKKNLSFQIQSHDLRKTKATELRKKGKLGISYVII